MRNIILTADASGAAWSGSSGLVVVVVDVIDFSTSMESAIDAGAAAVYGAAPDAASPPVKTDPYRIGQLAGRKAVEIGTEVVVLAEPRSGKEDIQRGGASRALAGVESAGAKISAVVPNLGAEIPRVADLKGKVVLGATGSGGVAFDAAVCAGSPAVLTGTVARTLKKAGGDPAADSARRAVEAAGRLGTGIAVVAASGGSLEDLLAAEHIYRSVLQITRQQPL